MKNNKVPFSFNSLKFHGFSPFYSMFTTDNV